MNATQQFFKGLLMTLMSILVAAFTSPPVDFLLLAVTAICTAMVYTGKNLVTVLQSDSPPSTISLINILSALLVSVFTGILEGVALFIIDGAIEWAVLWKVAASAGLTYITATFFTPPYSTQKTRLFAGEKAIARYRSGLKFLLIITLLSGPFIASQAQENKPFKGFFNEITPQLVAENTRASLNGTYLIRLDVGLACPAVGFKTNEEGKIIGTEGRDYAKMFAGLLYTHVKPNGMRDWGAGAGISVPYNNDGKYGITLLGGYNIFKVGVDYSLGLPLAQGISFLGGITVDLFNLTE